MREEGDCPHERKWIFSGSLEIQLPRLSGDAITMARKMYRVLFWFACVGCISCGQISPGMKLPLNMCNAVIDVTGFRFKATWGSESHTSILHHVEDEHSCHSSTFLFLGHQRYFLVRWKFMLLVYLRLSTFKQQIHLNTVFDWKRGPPRLQHSMHPKLLWIRHFAAAVSPFCGNSCCTIRAYNDGLWYLRRVSQVWEILHWDARCFCFLHMILIPGLVTGLGDRLYRAGSQYDSHGKNELEVFWDMSLCLNSAACWMWSTWGHFSESSVCSQMAHDLFRVRVLFTLRWW